MTIADVRSGALLAIAMLFAACAEEQAGSLPAVTLAVSGDCNVEAGCIAGAGDERFMIRFDAEPRALQPFPVSLEIDGNDNAQEVFVTFGMRDMDMGSNRYRLLEAGGNAWRGDVTLPICISGRSDWVAEFDVRLSGRRILLQVPFVLSR